MPFWLNSKPLKGESMSKLLHVIAASLTLAGLLFAPSAQAQYYYQRHFWLTSRPAYCCAVVVPVQPTARYWGGRQPVPSAPQMPGFWPRLPPPINLGWSHGPNQLTTPTFGDRPATYAMPSSPPFPPPWQNPTPRDCPHRFQGNQDLGVDLDCVARAH